MLYARQWENARLYIFLLNNASVGNNLPVYYAVQIIKLGQTARTKIIYQATSRVVNK